MSARRTVEVSACLWMDLLGYGSMLREARFDLTRSETKKAIERLFVFQDTVAKHSMRKFATVVLNDGCVAERGLTPRSRSVTYDFLRRAFRLHQEVSKIETTAGYPGVRSIVAVGFKHRRKSTNRSVLAEGVGERLVRKVADGTMPAQEAILTALAIKPTFDIAPNLQANFAFSKAYIADSKGTNGGFSGPAFYLDRNYLPDKIPVWVKYSGVVELHEPGIGGQFLRITELDLLPGDTESHELEDAFDIANRITGESDAGARMKKLRIVRTPR